MFHGRQTRFLTLVIASLFLLAPGAVHGQANGAIDFGSLLRDREPDTLIGSLKDEAQEKEIRERWAKMVTEDSKTAEQRNQSDLFPDAHPKLYPNPQPPGLRQPAGTIAHPQGNAGQRLRHLQDH